MCKIARARRSNQHGLAGDFAHAVVPSRRYRAWPIAAPTIEGVPRAQNRHLAPFRLPPSRKAILHTLRCPSDLTGFWLGCGDSASKLGLLRRGHRFEADVEIIVVGGRAVELHRPQALGLTTRWRLRVPDQG